MASRTLECLALPAAVPPSSREMLKDPVGIVGSDARNIFAEKRLYVLGFVDRPDGQLQAGARRLFRQSFVPLLEIHGQYVAKRPHSSGDRPPGSFPQIAQQARRDIGAPFLESPQEGVVNRYGNHGDMCELFDESGEELRRVGMLRGRGFRLRDDSGASGGQFEQFAQGRHLLAGKLRSMPRPRVQRLHLGERFFANRPVSAGGAIQGLIVDYDRDPVRRDMEVTLDIIDAELNRPPKRRERVFRGVPGSAAVAYA